MLNKTIKIIIGIAMLFLLAAAIFAFKSKDKNIENNGNESGELENSGNKLPESENISNVLLEELKNNHPEFSISQLKFYRETAGNNKEIIVPCEGRGDENECVASVAFLKGRTDICGHIENEGVKIECANAVLKKLAAEKIDKCWSLDDGHGFVINCLRKIFAIYDKPEACLSIISKETQQVCESLFYYEIAFIQRDIELCKKIINGKINQYCLNSIINKFSDSDNDGLSDLEETNKYHTNPRNPDTDGDGYTDGDEVKNGHNPLEK